MLSPLIEFPTHGFDLFPLVILLPEPFHKQKSRPGFPGRLLNCLAGRRCCAAPV
jgi:hypothetical protein